MICKKCGYIDKYYMIQTSYRKIIYDIDDNIIEKSKYNTYKKSIKRCVLCDSIIEDNEVDEVLYRT